MWNLIVYSSGLFTGVILMCMVQINRDKSKDKHIKELEDELAMSEYFK